MVALLLRGVPDRWWRSLLPAIAGTKPIVVQVQRRDLFPAPGLLQARAGRIPSSCGTASAASIPQNLKKKDPESWAIWPLVYQDPYRRVRDDEWPGQPATRRRDQAAPNRYNLFGTNQQGIDVFAQMVHGTTIALLVGFVSMGIAASIGIPLGALAGYFGGWVDMLISRMIEVVHVHSAAGADPGADRHLAKADDLARDGRARLHRLDQHRPADAGRVSQAARTASS